MKKLQKGSFTIEAVLWIPLLLSVMLGALQQGILFYQEFANREISDEVKNWDAVSVFYECYVMKELGEEINDE